MWNFDRTTRVLALTGAGISAESGIKTFRDNDGLWENHKVDEVATPDAFLKDPVLVWRFYRQRYQQSLEVEPNPAHHALATLEAALGRRFHMITQNVDGLHKRAGSSAVYEMHGSLERCFCMECRNKYSLEAIDFSDELPYCPKCESLLRPDIVWFGEIPYYLYEIEKLLKHCDVFLIVGTSGTVYPAAGFVMTAKFFGARTIAINLEEPDNRGFIDEFHKGKSGDLLPKLIDSWLNQI